MNSLRAKAVFEGANTENFQYESSSSSSSCSSCCDYRSDDSIPDWDDSVQENGDLFFVKCSPIICDSNVSNNSAIRESIVNGSKSSKLSTFLRKRKAKRRVKKGDTCRTINTGADICSPSKTDSLSIIGSDDITENFAAILYLNVEIIEDNDSDVCNNTIFHFPQTTTKNIINSIKGALLTLYHLLPKLVSEKPESSTIIIKNELVNVVYVGENKELMVIAFPESRCSLFELKQISSSIKRFLGFKFGSLHNCFNNPANFSSLNQFFSNLFIKLLKNSNNLSVFGTFVENDVPIQIEDLFCLPTRLPIPVSLETKIHEKLNEIEANDFGDLSEDHYGCQRLFTLIGTCLYYKGFLIVSHLNREDLLDVHTFLRYNDVLDLTINSCIDSLVIWQEVFLFSSRLFETNNVRSPNKRWFLLATGKEQGLLVTLFESGGCSVSSDGPLRPDELYVEQIQQIMNDILRCNLSEIVDQLTESTDLNSQKLTPRKSTENLVNTQSGSMKKLQDYDSEFNPSHHSSTAQLNGNEGDTFSESLSRTTSSMFSDEMVPVMGRRAQRMKQMNNTSGSIYSLTHSTLSDSDRSDYDTTGSSHSSSFSDVNKKFSKTSYAKRIIHGDQRTLFHFTNIDASRGVIVCSINANQTNFQRRSYNIMKNFKLSIQKIHGILSQKKLSTIGKFQRNSLPVKEYGILFEYFDDDSSKRNTPITFWVVGRAFNKAHMGEIYVCYEDKMPQNLVEIAFRLAMTS